MCETKIIAQVYIISKLTRKKWKNKKQKNLSITPKKTERKVNRTRRTMRKHVVNMINLNPNISVITFNVNGLNELKVGLPWWLRW